MNLHILIIISILNRIYNSTLFCVPISIAGIDLSIRYKSCTYRSILYVHNMYFVYFHKNRLDKRNFLVHVFGLTSNNLSVIYEGLDRCVFGLGRGC